MPRSPAHLLALSLLALLAGAALGCEGDPAGLEWGVRFASDPDRERARFVEATILRGGCDGDLVFQTGVPLVPGGTVTMPPNLGAGLYGFAGRARDEGCSWFVAGCEEATLPTMDPVIVTLEAVAESPACPADECDAGRCEADDAGSTDAAVDAPPGDSAADAAMDSSRDSALDSSSDSGPRDSGAVDTGAVDACTSCCPGDEVYDPTEMRCVSLQVDPENCGALDVQCGRTQYCTGGMCRCRPGLTRLTSGVCTDLTTDKNNCGSEGTVCNMGSEVTCRDMACEDTCNPGQTNCDDSCIDVDNDPRHCGACDNLCARDEVCSAGTCRGYAGAAGCSSCDECGATCGSGSCCPYGVIVICLDGTGACPG